MAIERSSITTMTDDYEFTRYFGFDSTLGVELEFQIGDDAQAVQNGNLQPYVEGYKTHSIEAIIDFDPRPGKDPNARGVWRELPENIRKGIRGGQTNEQIK